MARNQEYLSPEIVDQGIKDSGPYAGSPSFFINVRRGLPYFLSSVNLKYVKLGCRSLINYGMYIVGVTTLLMAFGTEVGKLTFDIISTKYFSPINTFVFMIILVSLVIVYLNLTPRVTYLVDFACFLPPNELKITKEEYIELAKKSGQFNDKALQFQQRVLQHSGIGDQTYLPRAVFQPGFAGGDLQGGRDEAAMLMFGAVDDLVAITGIRPKDIRILILNCALLNTTPSLSAMLVNRYNLSHRIQSYNLGGMGCAAGLTAVDLANDLLSAYPASYALIVSTEVIRFTWYAGNELDMLLPNCFLRLGAAAVLLSNRRLDRWRSKYQLRQLVRTHKGADDQSFRSIYLREDSGGRMGLSVSKDVIEVGGRALKANITTLSPLVLPVSEQFQFFKSLIFKKTQTAKPCIPDYKQAFEHVCIMATSKKVLDEIQEHLELTEEYMEASRKTLERFGNTSSSSIWYELAYLEAKNRINNGDRVWQLALGSGLKCNSVVWKAVRSVRQVNRNPWKEA